MNLTECLIYTAEVTTETVRLLPASVRTASDRGESELSGAGRGGRSVENSGLNFEKILIGRGGL